MIESENPYANSLLKNEFRGGDIAETGFTFQDNMILASIPGWLRRQSFTSMIREATGDYEALFFYPSGQGCQRLGVECKGHTMLPKEFWDEVENFRQIDSRNLGAYSRFLIQSTGVGETLKPVLEALRRIRGAWPFYDHGAPAVQADSYAEYENLVVKKGRSAEQAEFLFSKVEVDWNLSKEEEVGITKFVQQLQTHFPETMNATGRDLRDAGYRVRDLLRSRKAQPVLRGELEEAIWREMPASARPDFSSLTIFTAHDDASWRGADQDRLVFDWRQFFGGPERHYPAPETWRECLRGELQACKAWIGEQSRPRRLLVTGSRRNSAEFAIGHVFRSAADYVLLKEQKDALWRTDEHANGDTPDYQWEIIFPEPGPSPELAVCIAVLGHHTVGESFVTALREEGTTGIPLLSLSSSAPLVSAAHVNRAVQTAKNELVAALSSTGARLVRLYLWGPAVFALFLGHRLNIEAEVLCFEKDGSGRYVPTWRF